MRKDLENLTEADFRESYSDCVALYEQQQKELKTLKDAAQGVMELSKLVQLPEAAKATLRALDAALEAIKPSAFQPLKMMDLFEFRDFGYLQEANRLFFHPLGLALQMDFSADQISLGGVWDYRDDPEGILFGKIDTAKAARVYQDMVAKHNRRLHTLGFVFQPSTAEGT